MKLLKIGLVLATPADPKESEEVTRLAASLDGAYGKGKYCPDRLKSSDHPCLDIEDITQIMATSNKPDELLDAWRGWHAISPPMRKDFTRFVELSNKGARELGFKDTGAMWRSKYDMAPDDFSKELDRLWDQVRPLYLSLHSYVRWKLHEKYGDAVPANGPDSGAPAGQYLGAGLDQHLQAGGARRGRSGLRSDADSEEPRIPSRVEMVQYGESFFTSLGFAPLPATFWERSLFTKPRDRDVVCHRQRLGHRLRGRSARQDVHRHHRRVLRHDPP